MRARLKFTSPRFGSMVPSRFSTWIMSNLSSRRAPVLMATMLGSCPEGCRPTTRQALTPSISVWGRPDTEGYTRPLHKPVQTPSLASWQRIDPMATDYLTVEASRRPIRIEQASEPSLGIGYSVSTQTTTTDVRRKRKTHGRKNATGPSQAPGLARLSLG